MTVNNELTKKIKSLPNYHLDDSVIQKLGIKEIKDMRGLPKNDTFIFKYADFLVCLEDENALLVSGPEQGLITILENILRTRN